MFIDGSIESYTFKGILSTIITLNVLMIYLYLEKKNVDEYVKHLVFCIS